MTGAPRYLVSPVDEDRYVPGPEQLSGESYYVDVVTNDGSLGGYLRRR